MIPSPDEVDLLRRHVSRINYFLVRESAQPEIIIAFIEAEGEIPSEELRIELAELYSRRGWLAESGIGNTTEQPQIRFKRP